MNKPTSHCAAVCGSAQAVESQIVGYNTATVQGTDELGNVKWNLIAIQFKDVSGNTDEISLAKAIDMSNIPAYAGTWKTRTSGAPMLQLWDGTDFVSYFYVAPACSGLDANAWVTGTAKADVGLTTMLKAGDSVWFTANTLGHNTGTITLAGAVKGEKSSTILIGAQEWSMGANPYPTTFKVNDIVPSFEAYAGTWKTRTTGAPMLQLWDGTDFVSYFYVAPACSGLEANAWVTGTAKAATTDVINPGAGFWFCNRSGEEGTLQFVLGK